MHTQTSAGALRMDSWALLSPRTRTSAGDQGRHRRATAFAVLRCKAAGRLTPFRPAAVNSMELPMLPAGMAAISSQDASWPNSPTRAYDKGLCRREQAAECDIYFVTDQRAAKAETRHVLVLRWLARPS